MTTALFVTRAQPFHRGHLKVVKDILRRNDRIIIAIGSAQAKNTEKNPFSAREREEMISRALNAVKIKNYEIIRVPDLYDDQAWVSRINRLCKFDHVYSLNPWTTRCFRRAGVRVRKHELYQRRSCSGTKIRERILKRGRWEALVPRPVAEYIKKVKGVKKIQDLAEKGR